MHNFKETGTVQYYKGQSEKNQLTTWQRTLLANNAACAFQFRLCLPQPFPLGTYLHTSHCIQDVQVPEFIQSQTTLQWSSTWHENTFILSDMHLSIHTNIVETMIFLNFRFTKLDNLPYPCLLYWGWTVIAVLQKWNHCKSILVALSFPVSCGSAMFTFFWPTVACTLATQIATRCTTCQ